jgi:hypothetical protein
MPRCLAGLAFMPRWDSALLLPASISLCMELVLRRRLLCCATPLPAFLPTKLCPGPTQPLIPRMGAPHGWGRRCMRAFRAPHARPARTKRVHSASVRPHALRPRAPDDRPVFPPRPVLALTRTRGCLLTQQTRRDLTRGPLFEPNTKPGRPGNPAAVAHRQEPLTIHSPGEAAARPAGAPPPFLWLAAPCGAARRLPQSTARNPLGGAACRAALSRPPGQEHPL